MQLSYKPKKTAELIDVSRSRLFELLASGELPSVKYGRTRLISHQAIERFLKIDPTEVDSSNAA